ncbi:MAG: alpha-amylase family glycosyl hydrolase [Sulfuricella sp.]|nr:alpha-amylase family glycosyl hydrolase [Sulfuricella sp.]
MGQGPRIYNLFPLLAGSLRDWETQLPRIAGLGFDWVFLNPFHYPGFSGSLYAVKDYYRLHPLFQGHSGKSADELLAEFLRQAEEQGINVMMDLVINHTAKDALLVEQHPEWFAREADGSIRSPFALDPDHPDDVSRRTVWGDLAEINYEHPVDRDGLIAYWKELVLHYTQLGFHGFRCDAAYKVPGAVWAQLIEAARSHNPEAHFFAETLGAQPPEVAQLHAAGFDYLFNSAKWWDFRADWLLDQYETYRHIAPSVAFPESHDTERLAAESSGDERVSRLRYLFAAFFSAGVMMPMGFEYGFRRKLDVVKTRPEDWEETLFDIGPFVRAVNAMKSATPVLNEEGRQVRFTSPDSPLVGLLRQGEQSPGRAAALINRDPEHDQDFAVHALAEVMGSGVADIREITPENPHGPLSEHDTIHLAPLEMRVFHVEGAG